MKKWMIRALSALLIAAFLPLSVLADEYDLTQGSVTVSTTKGADGSTLYLYGTHPGWGATGDAAKNFLATIGLAVGDKITVIGAKTSYNGATQMKNAIYFSHTKAQ